MDLFNYSPRNSHAVKVGNTYIGGGNPLRLQSMTTTLTTDTEASVEQCIRIIDAGADLVRLTTQGLREAENLRNIRAELDRKGYHTPLVADVHFNPQVADLAATIIEKVRINPGNYVDPARTFKSVEYTDEEYAAELQRLETRFKKLLAICRENGTAIRIGVNHGSLSDRIMCHYGDTPAGIVESCMEFLRIFRRNDFHDIVISIKSSNTVVMVQSVRLLVKTMEKEDMHYPLHLGVTEAGEGEDGRIKSAVGIGALLTEGIGDTIRVSLSENPEYEIPVARKLVSFIDECTEKRETARIDDDTLFLSFDENCQEDLQLKAAMSAGAILIDGKAKQLVITNKGAACDDLAASILQAARVKFTKTEFISCPGCGRTLYNLQGTIAKIKSAITEASKENPKFKTLKIGIMGCIVNGPGEMADADYGYVGAGPNKISLYKKQECMEKNIPEDEAVDKLIAFIKNDND